jgi:hypothetical protein
MLVRSDPRQRDAEAGVQHAPPGHSRQSVALIGLGAALILLGVALAFWPSPGGMRVGLTGGHAEDLTELDWAGSVDARILRHEFKTPPDAWDDDFYREAARRGISVVPLINTHRVPATPAARERFARLVRTHVERYGPGGSFWDDNPVLPRVLAPRVFEVMNEPYVETHGGPYAPAAYAALVRRTAQVVRPVDPDARLAIALATSYFGSDRNGAPWLSALYDAEPRLNDYFDVASVHPYAANPDRCDPHYRWCFRQLEVIHSLLRARGAGDKPVYVTEVGNNTKGASAVSEEDQARYLKRYVERARAYGYVDALLYYSYRDNCDDAANKECWMGLVRADGSRKPAFAALRDAAASNP